MSSDPVALWQSSAGVPWPAGITVGTGPRGLERLGSLGGQPVPWRTVSAAVAVVLASLRRRR